MFNKTVFFTLLVCTILFGAAVWFYLQEQQQSAPLEEQHQPIMVQNLHETANIERQIEQVKVEKDPPEIFHLKSLVEEFENDSTKWDILIAIGDIYRKGAYPRYLPNEELAGRIYKIAAMCPNGKVAGMAQSKYVETYDDPIKDIDKAGVPLPQQAGLRICDLAESAIQTTPWHLFEKPIAQSRKEPEPQFMMQTDGFEEIIWNNLDTTTLNEVPAYRMDSQNVHDHGVVKTTHFNIEKLKDNIDIRSLGNKKEQEIESVVNSILSHKDLDAKTKEEALFVIDKLGDSTHSSFNVSEREALAMVWDKINKQDNNELKSNLVETLAKQLSSAIEKGHIVCSSGKISRIMGTLDGVSNEVTRPMWAVREELGSKAAKIREEMTEKYGDTPEAGRRMQEEFAKQVKEEYIQKLGMSQKIIDPLISEYSLGF